MTETSLKRARELLTPYFDMLDALGPGKMNRDVHSQKLAAALDASPQEARLEEANLWDANAARPQHFIPFCDIVHWAEERIAALEQRTEEQQKATGRLFCLIACETETNKALDEQNPQDLNSLL
jgi:hypothetical protein